MRADYFVGSGAPDETWIGRHPLARVSMRVVKNLLGMVLLFAGIAMMVLPGQGIITVLVALTLLDFPGKRRLELRIIRQPQVLRAVNWVRTRARRHHSPSRRRLDVPRDPLSFDISRSGHARPLVHLGSVSPPRDGDPGTVRARSRALLPR